MDVDVIALGVFAAIAATIALATWTGFRHDMEKRQRLEKAHRRR